MTTRTSAQIAAFAAAIDQVIPAAVRVDDATAALAAAPDDSIVIITIPPDAEEPTVPYEPVSEDLRDLSPLRATGVSIRLARADLTQGGPRDRRARQLRRSL